MAGVSKRKFITALSMAILVLLASVLFVRWSISGWLAAEQEKYADNRRTMGEIEHRISLRIDLEREVQKVEDSADIIRSAILKRDEVSSVIEELESIASDTGNVYRIQNIQEVRDAGTSKVTELNFTLQLDGSFGALLSFLREIRELPYLTSVTQFSTKSSGGENISTGLTLKVYVN